MRNRNNNNNNNQIIIIIKKTTKNQTKVNDRLSLERLLSHSTSLASQCQCCLSSGRSRIYCFTRLTDARKDPGAQFMSFSSLSAFFGFFLNFIIEWNQRLTMKWYCHEGKIVRCIYGPVRNGGSVWSGKVIDFTFTYFKYIYIYITNVMYIYIKIYLFRVE